MFDADVCYRAMLARDSRFDGRFFIGVQSTGIFCRPVCPVPPPKRQNIVFLPSAAAAQALGLRPCLRCRPEAAPNTPAWSGSATTVRRALRRISEGALNSGSVDDLAAELGMSERHLRRLFAKHLGANPRQVAHTERVLLAKRLLDETDLPMTEVAMAAGFNSVRRFNEVIRGVYDRTPSELRRNRRHARSSDALLGTTLRLPFRPPYDWRGMQTFFGTRAIPGVEEVQADVYRRVIAVGCKSGFLEVRPGTDNVSLLASFHLPESTPLMPLMDRARHLFDLEADSEAIDAALARDPRLRDAVRGFPGSRVPGCWDPFELGVRAIVGQQISVAKASAITGRIAEKFGRRISARLPFDSSLGLLFPRAEEVAEADLAGLGMPCARAATVRSFATAVARESVDLGSLADARATADVLEGIAGVGPWTAAYIAMRVARDPDAFLETDLGVRRALAGVGVLPSPRVVRQAARAWQPWRAYAVVHLWRAHGRKSA